MHALGLGKHDYWRFLRRVYGMSAVEAWEYIKRIGTPPTAPTIRAALKHFGIDPVIPD